MEREVITFPGPGGSRVSCCIIPCGCVLVLLIGLFLGGVGLVLHLRQPAPVARITPAVTLSGPR